MNKERIQTVINKLKELPVDEFDYNTWFSFPGNPLFSGETLFVRRCAEVNGPPACKTAGCVAGHTILAFWEESRKGLVEREHIENIAGRLLDIDYTTQCALFRSYMESATKEDAIKRLEHLLEYGHLEEYDWAKESWNQE